METNGLKKVQSLLEQLKLDAYLIYDFRGSNFIGRQIAEFSGMNTRRLVILVDKEKVYTIASQMEKSVVTGILGEKLYYVTYHEFQDLVKSTIKKYNRIALDYSPQNSLPVADIVPGGFLEFLKTTYPSKEFISAENLTQYAVSSWGEAGYKTHKEASEKLKQVFDLTFDYIKKALYEKRKVTDYDVSVFALKHMEERNLHNDGENICIVSTRERTSDPHYWPTKERNYVIEENSPLIVDMWARTKDTNSIYSDFTLYAWVGPDKIPVEILKAWDVLTKARDLSLEFLNKNINNDVKGFELDKIVYEYISKNGYAKHLLHRTGHSLGRKEHGSGANIDDFETHDTRLLVPDSGFTIEPGIYREKDCGVRGEIDVYIHPDKKIEVTTPLQKDIIVI